MRILLTNDDGIHAEGLATLERIARTLSDDVWVVAPETGGEIRLELSYAAGRPHWGHDEARPYSAAKPEFHRIYRYDQLADLAMSTALGKALDGEISFSASVPGLDSVFDGREVLTAVLVVPVYVREVSLP